MWELYCGQNAFEKLQHPGQFYESVVLADLRPVIPPGMPADLQILMEHCWSSDPAARPSIDRVLQCLEFMVSERQQLPAAGGAGGGVGTPSASAPMPSLLTSQPLRKQQHWWQQPQFLSRHVPLLMQLGSDSGSRAATASSQVRAQLVGWLVGWVGWVGLPSGNGFAGQHGATSVVLELTMPLRLHAHPLPPPPHTHT